MHTRSPVHTDWLFSCNVQALLARCPRHMQSVFELDSGHPYEHPCYGQLTAVKKGIRWPVSPDCIVGSIVQLIEVLCFLKLSADQLLVLIDCRLRSIMKRSIIIINNLLTSSFGPYREISDLTINVLTKQYIKASVWHFPVMTSLLVNE